MRVRVEERSRAGSVVERTFDAELEFGPGQVRMLRATADTLGELTAEQLRPVELALTEFLVANLAQVMSRRLAMINEKLVDSLIADARADIRCVTSCPTSWPRSLLSRIRESG